MNKAELISFINSLDDEKVINVLMETVSAYQTDFWEQLSESDQKEIEIGIKQLDEGQRISFSDALK